LTRNREQTIHWRRKHLEVLAEELARIKNTQAVSELKNLKAREKQRDQW
jgi:hypothetical protein